MAEFISSIHYYFSVALSNATGISLQGWDHGTSKTIQYKRKLFLRLVPELVKLVPKLKCWVNLLSSNQHQCRKLPWQEKLWYIKQKAKLIIYNFLNSHEFIKPGEMYMYCSECKKFFANSSLDSILETYCSVFSLKLFQGHCLIFI